MTKKDEIPNEQLTLADVPRGDADMNEIFDFALTFNGFKEHGTFDACARIANQQQPKTLNDFRTCLFFEQRRWHHFGDYPDGEDDTYIRSLVGGIRQMLEGKPG